jgi:CubicO group peptidase (beta-lactamase class C family)
MPVLGAMRLGCDRNSVSRMDIKSTIERRSVAARIGAATLAVLAGAAVAAPGATAAPEAEPPTPEAIQAFLDTEMPRLLERSAVPGASVSVVSGGEVVFADGYGLADVEEGTPMEADTPVFIASVTKLITATAVMQQVERGRLDPDADINGYLDGFAVPDTFPGRPITVRHLMTHTAGFDGLVLGTGTEGPEDVGSLREYVEERMPDRVRPPGQVASYDNYAFSLAGYLVESVTGEPFGEYVAEHVFEPLGMSSSTAGPRLPDAIADALAKGHLPSGDGQVEIGGQYGKDVPAGAGVVSTAVDMARFMNAHLDGGAPLLSEESADVVHSRQFSNDERLPGIGWSFMERFQGEQRLIEHGGDSPGFHSVLTLLPDVDTGLFVVVNGDGTDEAPTLLTDAFLDHFYPVEQAPAPGYDGNDGAEYEGVYLISRNARSDASSMMAFIAHVVVRAEEDGTLEISGVVESPGTPFRPIGEDLYEADGELLGFSRDADGRIAYLHIGSWTAESFERLAWYQDPRLHLWLLAGSLIVMLSVLWWPVAAAVRRLRGSKGTGPRHGRARLVAGLAAGTAVAGTAVLLAVMSDYARALQTLLIGGSPVANGALALYSVAALATAGTVAAAVWAWRRRWWNVAHRLHFTVLALAAVVFVATVHYYRLVGWPVLTSM